MSKKPKNFYSFKFHKSVPYFQSKGHMKHVFCRGLAVSSLRDDRSYATVAAVGISPGSCTDSDDRKVLGLLP